MRLDFFIKLKSRSNTIISSVSIKYSVRDLLCDVSNYARQRYASHTINDVSAPSGINQLALASFEFHF